ncbi:MAG TPA: translesion error-prone DNA polymerase V autoproteolytic subunit [Puia sp.]
MKLEQFFGMTYKGTKRFTQHEIPTANATGFGAAADDYMERGIDLNEQLVRNKPATFFMRVSGDAMTGAGIFHGDVVIVDRSIKATSGKVIIATLNGEMLIRRFEKTFNKIRLVPETPKLSAIDVDLSGSEFSIWGVVTYVIHSL